jgi:hypothetical protein
MTKTGEVLTMDNGKGIKTDSIKFELYTSDASLVRNAAELSEADIRELIDALKIDDFEHLPEGNQEILRYFYKNILPTLEYRDGELIGDVHGTGLAECKEWLQMNIILNSTGVLVPNNATKESGKWLSDEYAVAQLLAEENFENFLDRSDAKSGDVIQMYINDGDRHFPHTMVIGNITSDGIWVFDTNYAESSWSLVSNVPPNWNISGYTKGIINSQNGLPRELTADEIASGVVPTHWLQSDNSIRYHYISFAELNTVQAATLQRINI